MQLGKFLDIPSMLGFIPDIAIPLTIELGTSIAIPGLSIAISGAATTNKDYIYYDLPIGANDTFIATIGVTLAATDVVRVYASNTNLSFSLYGSEIS